MHNNYVIINTAIIILIKSFKNIVKNSNINKIK